MILIFLSILIGCTQRKGNVYERSLRSDKDSLIFTCKELNDSLNTFADRIDKNEFLYMVIVMIENADTLIQFEANLVPFISIEDDSTRTTLYIKGAKELNGKPCIIYYDGFKNCPSLINENVLNLERAQYDYVFTRYENADINVGFYSRRVYQLKDGKLILLKYKKSRYERS